MTEEHPFAPYIRILGKGKTGTRALDSEEAQAAFQMILRGNVEPVQLGAFLMLLRVKEETAEELAGFVRASRSQMTAPDKALRAELDWSCYAGKRHQHPWFILSMLLLAAAGHRVLVHGCAGHTPGRLYTVTAFAELNLPIAADWPMVEAHLQADNLCYLPLEYFCPGLADLIQLRPLLGLRSPVNTLTRLLNPLRAPASMQSVFHPAYAGLHGAADALLEQPASAVFKGESGEVEIKPTADTSITLQRDGKISELLLQRTRQQRQPRVDMPSTAAIKAFWRGDTQDNYGLAATLGTTAVALALLHPELGMREALLAAEELWQKRDRSRLS